MFAFAFFLRLATSAAYALIAAVESAVIGLVVAPAVAGAGDEAAARKRREAAAAARAVCGRFGYGA